MFLLPIYSVGPPVQNRVVLNVVCTVATFKKQHKVLMSVLLTISQILWSPCKHGIYFSKTVENNWISQPLWCPPFIFVMFYLGGFWNTLLVLTWYYMQYILVHGFWQGDTVGCQSSDRGVNIWPWHRFHTLQLLFSELLLLGENGQFSCSLKVQWDNADRPVGYTLDLRVRPATVTKLALATDPTSLHCTKKC